ncbi:MAG: cell division protein FtsA [Bacteroidales bacterium]|nr:cell division protein FtsA [Bacteroidales bacterium]
MKEKNTTLQPEIYVGLDIGTTKIATVVGFKNSEDKIEVLGFGTAKSTGVQHGDVQNLKKTIDGICQSVIMAEERADVDIESVYVGVAGRHIKSTEYSLSIKRKNSMDFVEKEEIDKMMGTLHNVILPLGQQIITVIPQNFIIDGVETTDPIGHVGNIIEGHFQVVTGNEPEITKIIRCVKEAQLEPAEITLEPLASGLACLDQSEREQGVVLVDIGGGTTDVAIYYNGNPVHTEVIPFGGNSITNDIVNVCRITDELAEKLKKGYGTCIEDKSNKNNMISIPQGQGMQPIQIAESYLAKIINARVMDSIINKVKEVILRAPYKGRLNRGVVLTGGGAELRHLKELFQYELALPVRIGKPIYGFVNTTQTEVTKPMYATAMGLLKYAIMSDEQSCNSPKVTTKSGEETGTDNGKNGGYKNNKDDDGEDFITRIKRYCSSLLKKFMETTA